MNEEIETIEIHGESNVDWQATAMRYIELNSQKVEAIQRVRKLAEKFDSSSHYTGHFVTEATIKALDGEQS